VPGRFRASGGVELRYVRGVKDFVVLGVLLLSFATLVTVHVAIAVRLGRRTRPHYRGLVAFLVPPLAPWWAYEQRWRRMCFTWLGAVACYLAALLLARC